VNMVRHDLLVNDHISKVGLLFEYKLLHSFRDAFDQNRSPVLRTKDNVVLATVDDGMLVNIPFVRLLFYHILPPLGCRIPNELAICKSYAT
jgi:hypothetical protein